MTKQRYSGVPGDGDRSGEYETVNIVKTRNVCPMCEDYAKSEASKPVVIMCCEGACLRGEIARIDKEFSNKVR